MNNSKNARPATNCFNFFRLNLKVMSLVMFMFSLISLNASNKQIAMNYLQKSFANYKDNPILAEDMLNKAGDYSDIYPEYDYIRYKLSIQNQNFSNHKMYAKNLINLIDNAFILTKADILRTAANIYKSMHEYENALKIYKMLAKDPLSMTQKDYDEIINMLFTAGFSDEIPKFISMAVKHFSNNVFIYYKALYTVRYDKNYADAELLCKMLEADLYKPEKIAYIRSYLDDIDNRIDQIENSGFDSNTNKEILYVLLSKNEQTKKLIELWLANGGNEDLRTLTLIDKFYSTDPSDDLGIIPTEITNYTGDRFQDKDLDGYPELVYTFKNGIIISKSFDKNQDRIFELVYLFDNSGNILTIEKKDAKNKIVYQFNKEEHSLNKAEFYTQDKLTKIYFIDTGVYPYKKDSLPDEEELIKLCSYEEINSNEIIRNKYYDGRKIYSLIDREKDGYFEYKITYDSDIINEGFLDTNKDGLYNVFEKYENGKLSVVYSRSVPHYPGYDYKEIYKPGIIERFWDDDFNGNYEIKEVVNNNETLTYFDINNDNIYDYMLKKVPTGESTVYQLFTNENIILYSEPAKKTKNEKGWNVVSIRKPESLKIPEDINLMPDGNGLFIYNGKKNYFYDNLIISDDFTYKIMKNRFGTFLFDCK